MKKIIILFLIAISINAQSWNSIVTTSISNASKIDNYASKDGIHILVKTSSNQIKYYLTDVSGTIIRSTSFTSSGDFPNIVGSSDGTKLYATYKDDNNIKTQYSTNAGNSWTELANIDVSSYPTLNTIDVVHDQGKTHITWATSNGGYKVHYKRYDNQNALGEYKEVTDYGSEFGFHPTVTANGNYVYVSYNAGINLWPAINVGAVKIRRKDLTTNQWDNPEQVPLTRPNQYGYGAKSRIERIFATDDYLYLFYFGSEQESMSASFISVQKDLSTNTWCSNCTGCFSDVGDPTSVTQSPQIVKISNETIYVFFSTGSTYKYLKNDGNGWNNGGEYFPLPFSVIEVNNDLYTISTGSSNLELRQYDDAPAKPGTLNSTSYNYHPKLYWPKSNEPDIASYKIYKDGGYLSTTSNTYYIDYTETLYFPGPGHSKEYVSYKIKAVDNGGNFSTYSNTKNVAVDGGIEKAVAENIVTDAIKSYALNSNYPNPFNPTTNISYQIPQNGFVNLIVYNALGQQVAELVNQNQSMGKYSVKFNAANLPSGVYIYKLRAGEFSSTKKMILAK